MIHAVIWRDMVPLSLICDSADSAITKAKAMSQKARENGVVIHDIRAVSLHETIGGLNVLWAAEQNC